MRCDSPDHDIAPMLREAWYYLRTSADPSWQIDEGPPSIPAALDFLKTIVRERIAHARLAPPQPPPDVLPDTERKTLLRRFRSATTGVA